MATKKKPQLTKPVEKDTKKPSVDKVFYYATFSMDGVKAFEGKGKSLLNAFSIIKVTETLKNRAILTAKKTITNGEKKEVFTSERTLYPYQSRRFFGNEMNRIAIAKFMELGFKKI